MGEGDTDVGSARPIGVGVIGFGWMGRVHAQAYARVRHHFPGLALVPDLVMVADEVPGRAEEAAAQFGFPTAVRDWRQMLTDPRVHAVSVTAPNWLHREIGGRSSQQRGILWAENGTGRRAEHQHSRLLLGLGRPGEDGYPVPGPLKPRCIGDRD